MEELKIVYLPPGELTPYPHNAKQHPDKQVEHIANSIREFGFRQPIVVDADNVVVIGHGRLMCGDSSKRGWNVLDLFGGSGSTLIACEQTGRRCYMMELDPHYVDVIVARWEKLTGEKAVLLN